MNPQQAAEIIALLEVIARRLFWIETAAIVLVMIVSIEFTIGKRR